MKNFQTEVMEDETRAAEFERLFLEHWPRVYRLLCRLVGDPAEAEDLALETFMRLLKQDARENGFNPGGWLHRVATNLGLQSIRSWKRREHYELKAGRYALEEASSESPLEVLAREEERRRVRQALARMNERQSQLLILRYAGLSYQEIARALQVAPTSVGSLLVRAERQFEKLYRALGEEE